MIKTINLKKKKKHIKAYLVKVNNLEIKKRVHLKRKDQ